MAARKKIEIDGTYNDLTVIRKVDPIVGSTGLKDTAYECKCKCGNTVIVKSSGLSQGSTTSCGCRAKSNIVSYIGRTFDRLLVLYEVEPIIGSTGRKRKAYRCWCECGTITTVKHEDLQAGDTRSCGCWNDDQRSARAQKMYETRRKYDDPKKATAAKIWQSRYSDGDISFEEFFELSQQICRYCRAPPSNKQNVAGPNSSEKFRQNADFSYNGLDRIDSTRGHTKDNCVPCCVMCNLAKSNYTTQEFFDWVERISNNLREEGVIK